MEKNTGYCKKLRDLMTLEQCQNNKQSAPARCGDCKGLALPAASQARGAVLMQAHTTINGERQDQYGNPENNFNRIASYWSTYKGVVFTAHDVAMMMALLKVARIQSGSATDDSYKDLCGYVALAADIDGKK